MEREDFFGRCECGQGADRVLTIVKADYSICESCKTYWLWAVGGLGPRPSEEESERNAAELEAYRRI